MTSGISHRNNQALLYINVIRLTLYTIFVIGSLLLYISDDGSLIWIFSAIYMSLALVWSIFLKRLTAFVTERSLLYSIILTDIFSISLLVYISGGIISPLYFLYLFPIIISASFLERRDTVVIASMAFILYGLLSDLIYLRVLPPFNADENSIPFGGFIYNLSLSFFSFLVVAVLSSFYFERIRLAKKELANAVANLKDLLELNSTLLDQIEDGFFTADSNRKIISYNKKARNLLNYSETKRPIQDLLQQALGRLSPEDHYLFFEYELLGKSLAVSVNRLQNVYSFPELFIFVIHDLTEKRIIEQELRKKEHLALIGEISAGMAHELRNPLASISGSVQFLQKRLTLEDDTQNLMQIIVTETKRLSRSIEDFLAFARESPVIKSTFNLTELLDEIIQINRISHPEGQKIQKEFRQHPVIIEADYEKIRQLIQNLISNALKAVEKKGVVQLRISREKDLVKLTVQDTGIGMDPSSQKEIFTPFYSKFSKGIGLGMAIVKKIVEEHGFEIEITSERGKGTEVTIWIQIKEKF